MAEQHDAPEIQIDELTYNPFAPGFAEDPYPHYARMRLEEPVHSSPLGFWMLFRYDDVARLLRDPSLSVEERHLTPTPLREYMNQVRGNRPDRGSQSMLRRDPPDHTRLRNLVTKAFTPRIVEGLRPKIAELVSTMLDEVESNGGADLIAQFAFPLPFKVIGEMLGVPETDSNDVRAWSGLLVRTLEPVVDPEMMRAIVAAGDSIELFVRDLVAWKREHPGNDLLTAMIDAEEQGDVLSDGELLEQVVLLYIAGHETTVNLIGNGILALLRNRDQLERLSDPNAAMSNTVEELLRFDSPVQMSRRITLEPIEIGERLIDKGSFVVLGLASANRDEDRFGASAGALDITRRESHQHLSFGGGAHYCLGASLARIEAEIAIDALVSRFPRIELSAEPAWNGRLNLRGLDHLHVSV
ncbi:MAG: cytochrome P450 [Actinomycetota bacterium]